MNAQPSFPRHFSYFVNRLAGGFKKNKVRLQPISGSTISPNQTFQVRLPTNALIIPDSFNIYATIAKSGDSTKLPDNATIPQHGLASMFNRVDVRINGSSVHQGGILNWNNLYNMMFVCQGSKELVRKNAGLNRAQPLFADDITASNPASVSACCSEWVGTWLSSCRPGVQSTSLLGEVIVEILTASAASCMVGNNSYANADYSLANVYATIEVCQFDNDVYLPMLFARIQSGESLPCLYTHVSDFQQTATGSGDLRISVASNCLDMILVSHRLSSEQTGANALFGTTSATSIVQNNTKRGKQFVSRAIAANDDAGTNRITQYQFQVDGQLVPANPVSLERESYNHLLRVLGQEDNLLSNNLLLETYEIRQAFGAAEAVSANVVYADVPGCKVKSATATSTLSNWVTPLSSFDTVADYRYNAYYNGNFFAGLSLRDEAIGKDENYLSGYSTKGSVAEILYKLTITGSYSPLVDIFCFQTAVMNIGAQQVLRIEY